MEERKIIRMAETQSGNSDIVIVEERLSDGSKVYNVETYGHGSYYHVLANARDEQCANECFDAIVAATYQAS